MCQALMKLHCLTDVHADKLREISIMERELSSRKMPPPWMQVSLPLCLCLSVCVFFPVSRREERPVGS